MLCCNHCLTQQPPRLSGRILVLLQEAQCFDSQFYFWSVRGASLYQLAASESQLNAGGMPSGGLGQAEGVPLQF